MNLCGLWGLMAFLLRASGCLLL
uniref:Uncharacterized protein n=1 Tax=Anguilla anguilla TaxID=7936 RepID=A0A0E9RN09_ANGAN